MREALEQYDRAYQAWHKVPEAPPEALCALILAWAPVAFKAGGYAEVIERLTEAESIAREMQDKRRLASALSWIGNVHAFSGFPSRGIAAMMESQELATALGNDMLTMLPLFMTTSAMVDRDPAQALEHIETVIQLAEKHRQPGLQAHAIAVKAQALARLGDFTQAGTVIQEALDLAERSGSLVKLGDVNALASLIYYDMGEVERGLEHGHIATEMATSAGAGECAVYSMYCVGRGNLLRPDLVRAQAVFDESIRKSDALTNPVLGYLARGGAAVTRAMSGDADALRDIETAIESARLNGDAYYTAYLLHGLAESALLLGDLDRAERSIGLALDYYRGNSMRPYIAHALQTFAAIRERQLRDAEAAAARAEAEELLQDAAIAGR